MKNFLQRLKRSSLLTSMIWCVLGVVLLVWTELSARILCYALGGVLVVHGIAQIVPALRSEEREPGVMLELLIGIAVMLCGAWAIFWPDAAGRLIPVILGVITLIHGLEELLLVLRMRKSGAVGVPTAFAVVTVALGALLIWRPDFLAMALLQVTGLCLLFDGAVRAWMFRVFARIEDVVDELPSDSYEK